MTLPVYDSSNEVAAALQRAIESSIPEARVTIAPGSPGHFAIEVVAKAFEGKSMVQQQQLVYAAIEPLMRGDGAPVHAVDRLRTAAA